MGHDQERRLDADAITAGFEAMGRYLAERGATGEIAVYGGTAILLRYDWRSITQDVDALVASGHREDLVKDAAAYAGLLYGLPPDWLNNFVGGFTPLSEAPDFFEPYAAYPREGETGLRVKLASTEYLCAMKLKAIERADPRDKDFDDAVRLAREAGVSGTDGLGRLFERFFPDEELPDLSLARLPEVAAAIDGPAAEASP